MCQTVILPRRLRETAGEVAAQAASGGPEVPEVLEVIVEGEAEVSEVPGAVAEAAVELPEASVESEAETGYECIGCEDDSPVFSPNTGSV